MGTCDWETRHRSPWGRHGGAQLLLLALSILITDGTAQQPAAAPENIPPGAGPALEVPEPPAAALPAAGAGEEAMHKALVAENEKLRSQIEELQAHLLQTQQTSAKQEARVAQLVGDETQKQQDISSLSDELQRVIAAKSAVEEKLSQEQAEKAALQDENKKLVQERDTNEWLVQQKETTIQSNMQQCEQEKAEKDTTIQAHSDTIQKHLADIEMLNTKKEKLMQEYKDLEAKYSDPSLQHFLMRKGKKVYAHPGIEGAANKTFRYILPHLRAGGHRGQQWLNDTTSSLNSKLFAYVGGDDIDPWLPFVSGFLVYGLIFLPLLCAAWCLTRVVCKLKPCLLFCHLYLALNTICAGSFAAYAATDPLLAFAAHDPSLYFFTQTTFGCILPFYLLMLCLAYCCSRGGSREWCYRLIQVMIVGPVSAVYFILVWTPSMVDQMPRMQDVFFGLLGTSAKEKLVSLPYFGASALFFTVLRMEQLAWRAGDARSLEDKDIQMSIEMKNGGELRGVEELASMIGNQDPDSIGKDQ